MNIPIHLRSVQQILDRGLKSNSYKFALLRALADWGASGKTDSQIPFSWLASRFLKYYWTLTVTFPVRQATDPTRDPVIMRFIRAEMQEFALSSRTQLEQYRVVHPERYDALAAKCAAKGGCFDEVIPRFHNLGPNAETASLLYRHSAQEIHLENGALEFLQTYHRTLQLLAIGGWVKFTEQFTFAPKLYVKIAGIPPERKLSSYRKSLGILQGNSCFYCGKESTSLHIDHVIPWCFVLEDRIWNLVLACSVCNLSKSDRVPDSSSIQRLRTRNSRLLSERSRFNNPRIERDLREFAAQSLGAHVQLLWESCQGEGFAIWQS